MNLHLTVTLGLLAAAGAAIYFTPAVKTTEASHLLVNIPETAAGWSSTEGAQEELLPQDPNERAAIRRTYHRDGREALISVALFTRQDDPARRPSINLIYPQRAASLITRSWLELKLGDGRAPVSIPMVIVHRGDQRVAVLYWHQIRTDAYGSEYRFRLALLRRALFAREADSWLVRITTPAVGGDSASLALGVAANIAPFLYRAIAEAGR